MNCGLNYNRDKVEILEEEEKLENLILQSNRGIYTQ